MNRVLEFTVAGLPQTKGSTRGFVVPGKGGGKPRAIITNDNPKAKDWQQTIAKAAAVELLRPEHRGQVFAGAVVLAVVFFLPRPKKYLTAKFRDVAVPHTTRPDVDKCLRLAGDALSKLVWADDAQVTDVIARKRYCAAGEFPRAVIRVREAHAGGL